MAKPRRKPPSLREKLAAVLVTWMAPDADGKLCRVISQDEARTMSADDVLRRFDWDHVFPVALGGDNRPLNLQPLPVPAHKIKTRRDRKNISKQNRREKRAAGREPKARMPYTQHKDAYKRTFAGKVVPR